MAHSTTAEDLDVGTAGVSPNQAISGASGRTNVHVAERIASGLAGAALATFAVARKRSPLGAAIAAAGTYLIYRGVTGRCAAYSALRTGTAHDTDSETAAIPHGQGVRVEQCVTINKSAHELFTFWRNFENLPRFMAHLESVTVHDSNRSHWAAKAPFGKTVEWDAEVVNETPDQMIAWRSAEGADIPNAGSVWFKPAENGQGTEVRVSLEYNPPAGLLGAAVARIWGEEPSQQVTDDLNHFKNIMEGVESPPAGGKSRSSGKPKKS